MSGSSPKSMQSEVRSSLLAKGPFFSFQNTYCVNKESLPA
jgi:hypothetical protein